MKKMFGVAVWICIVLLGLSTGTVFAQEGQDAGYDTFVEDLIMGLKIREQYGKDVMANADESGATSERIMQFYSDIAGQEWDIMKQYADMKFDADNNISKNQEYKRQVYMDGLQQQVDALQQASGDWQKFLGEWEEGYLKRARVIVEIATYEANEELEGITGLLADMRDKVGVACEKGSHEVYVIQGLLTGIEVDGQPGDGTRSALKDFQERHGMDINGVICEDLINLMREKVTKEAYDAAVATADQYVSENVMIQQY